MTAVADIGDENNIEDNSIADDRSHGVEGQNAVLAHEDQLILKFSHTLYCLGFSCGV
jgi:hypothetical protein